MKDKVAEQSENHERSNRPLERNTGRVGKAVYEKGVRLYQHNGQVSSAIK
jgi:hypothetical protein